MKKFYKWRMKQSNDDFHYTTGIFHTLYTIAIITGLIMVFFFAGCSRSGIRPAPEYNKHDVKNYIVDKYNLKYFQRGVYDMNRNDKVDVGIDMFFFAKNPYQEGGAHIWYLHSISKWEDIDGVVDFAISSFPVKIEVDDVVDNSGDGVPDVRYYAKPGIEHDGYIDLFNEVEIIK